MKLKKTHFLLIAIAVVLLIGIGSVCASENVTDDSGDALADDGTDVVLSDTDGNVLDDTSEEKTNTTVETDKPSYEFKQDSNKTVTVDVKDNESQKISIDKRNLSIANGNKNISFEYSGSIVTITEALPVGNYNLTINYLGNENYINSTKVIAVKIYGNNTIETVTSVVCDGKNIEIPVNVTDQVDYIELIKDNFNLTLVYTNETGNVSNLTITSFDVENDKIKFESPVNKLINASVIIDYANATEPKTVAIKVSTEIKATVDKDKYESEEIKNISIEIKDGQGNLINVSKTDLEVFEDGTAVAFTYNNGNITITSISEGAHNLTIVYKGNETYNASTTNVELNVYGKNQIIVPEYIVISNENSFDMHIIIFNGLENVVINEDNLTLNLTYTNETGDITSTIIGTANFEIAGETLEIYNINYPLIRASLSIDYVNSTGAKTVKINLNTAVNANPASPKYRYNETNNITVEVFDNKGNPLTIGANDLKVFDNGNEIQFTFNSSNITVNLAEGVHNLTITYKGDATYNSSSTTIKLKVYGDLRINPDEVVVLDENDNATIFVNLNDGADIIPIESKDKLNVTLFYTVGNQTFNRTVDVELIDGKNITFKVNEDFDSAYVNIVYDNTLTGNTTVKVNTEINASDLVKGESEAKNFTIEVKGTNGHIINITKDNIQVLKDGTPLNIEVNNSVITIKDAIKIGAYNLTIKYIGENAYLASNRTIALTVYGINATTSTNFNSSKKGEIKVSIISGNETINITSEDLILNVTYKNGNDTIEIKVTEWTYNNGTLTFTLENANFTGTATLTVKYNATEATVTLNRIYNAKIELITIVNEYKTGNYTFRLVDIDDGSNITNTKVKLTTVGNVRAGFSATTDSNGIFSFKNINLYEFDQSGGSINMKTYEVGNHTVDLESETSNVKATKVTTNLTVTPANVKIVINPYKEYYGSTKNVTITVTNSLGEPMPGIYVKLTIDGISGTYYLYTDSDGNGQIAIYSQSTKSGLVGGDYTFHASNNDTKNIVNTTTTSTVTVVKIPVVINGKDVTVQYNTGTTYTIKVTKDGKGIEGVYIFVRLYSTSTKYSDYIFQTGKDGKISFSASLAVGKHKIIVTSADNRYEASQITKTITVKKASAKITAKKVTAYYKGGKYFTVKVTNKKNKKPIYDAKVNIKIYFGNRYYNYTGNTGMNGKLKLLLDSLKPRTYKVVVSSADNKNFEAKQVTTKIVIKKAPAKLIAKKLTAKKGAVKYFKVKVKNKKTKKVIKGVKVKVKVYTGKKAKTYKIKTNKKGIAKLSTAKLKVGKHKVVVTSANKYVKAKKTKSTIKIKK